MKKRNTEEALRWIVALFHKHQIPFQISGGFAARLYGSNRELNDIDIGIPDDCFEKLYPDVKEYVVFGPEHYKSEKWNLKLMALRYKNQKIDIAGRNTISFFSEKEQKWIPAHRDLTEATFMEVYGLTVPVIPKDKLIAYKKRLGREVDLLDIENLERKN